MKIFISSDHGGYELKKFLVKLFEETKVEYLDLGPYDYNENDDYPDYGFKLAETVVKTPNSKGILICKNGVGVCISANKVKNARAGISWNPQHTKSMVNDDHTNILCIPADYLSKEQAVEIVEAFLLMKYSSEERHLRRLEKIKNYEK